MKMTLLEIVQDILNSMDSDEVNTISETIESDQVAQVVKTTYYELISRRDWPHLKEMFQLDASGTTARPTHMSLPDRIVEMREVFYDVKQSGETRVKREPMKYLTPEEFMWYTNSRNSDASNIDVITDPSGTTLLIRNDNAPEMWTSFDDENIVFDSYDSGVESTLQQSKTQCFGIRQPTWTVSDSFTPDLPDDAFPLLLAESKAIAQFQVRQFQDQAAMNQANRQRFRMSRKSWAAHKPTRYPNYGRKARSNYRGNPPKDGYVGH